MSGKVVLGTPENADKVQYQEYYATKVGAPLCHTLESTLESAVQLIGKGGFREGGEVFVPIHIWNTSSFQKWYKQLKLAGNSMKKARVAWIHRTKKRDTVEIDPLKTSLEIAQHVKRKLEMPEWTVFFWALHVEIFITKENRVKANEIVISRHDISSVLMYKKGNTLSDTEVVLVREFRSPVANETGYVWELPGLEIYLAKK